MSSKITNSLKLSKVSMDDIDKRMTELTEQGIQTSSELSGELNMSGCASGYCQAWA